MAAIFCDYQSPALAINGTADHVHILTSPSRKIALRDLLEKVKKSSSKWIKTKDFAYRNFYWQNGYGAFSVGQSGAGALKRYSAAQKEHHCKRTFQEELRAFLELYRVEYDERYVWD